MLILTNKQFLSIFETKEPIHKKPIYYPKKANIKNIAAVGIEKADNRENLQPIDKLIFFACLSLIQSNKEIITTASLYRQITGKTKGEINISNEMKHLINSSLYRLKDVILHTYKIEKGKNAKPFRDSKEPLLSFDLTEKGYIFNKNNYIADIIQYTKTARTIPPELITPYKNKSINMLIIEYDLLSRIFYLHKRKHKTKLIKQDINLYCKKYDINTRNRNRLYPFIDVVLNHLKEQGFINSFSLTGNLISIK